MDNQISREEEYASAKKQVKIGLITCVIGIAVTSLTYFMASTGGKYTVAYGAVIYGAYEGIRGLIQLLKLQKEDGNMQAYKKTLVSGIVTLIAIASISCGTYWYANKDYVDAVKEEQVYENAEFGFKVTFPAGLAKMEVIESAETDSTYQDVEISAFDNEVSYNVAAIKDVLVGKDSISDDEFANLVFNIMTIDYSYDTYEMDDPEFVEVNELNMIQYVGKSSERGVYMVQYGFNLGYNIYHCDLFIYTDAVKSKEEAIQMAKDFTNRLTLL